MFSPFHLCTTPTDNLVCSQVSYVWPLLRWPPGASPWQRMHFTWPAASANATDKINTESAGATQLKH